MAVDWSAEGVLAAWRSDPRRELSAWADEETEALVRFVFDSSTAVQASAGDANAVAETAARLAQPHLPLWASCARFSLGERKRSAQACMIRFLMLTVRFLQATAPAAAGEDDEGLFGANVAIGVSDARQRDGVAEYYCSVRRSRDAEPEEGWFAFDRLPSRAVVQYELRKDARRRAARPADETDGEETSLGSHGAERPAAAARPPAKAPGGRPNRYTVMRAEGRREDAFLEAAFGVPEESEDAVERTWKAFNKRVKKEHRHICRVCLGASDEHLADDVWVPYDMKHETGGREFWVHIHETCASWLADMFISANGQWVPRFQRSQSHGGGAQAMYEPVSTARGTQCSHCRLPGGGIVCRKCKAKSYHFGCASDLEDAFRCQMTIKRGGPQVEYVLLCADCQGASRRQKMLALPDVEPRPTIRIHPVEAASLGLSERDARVGDGPVDGGEGESAAAAVPPSAPPRVLVLDTEEDEDAAGGPSVPLPRDPDRRAGAPPAMILDTEEDDVDDDGTARSETGRTVHALSVPDSQDPLEDDDDDAGDVLEVPNSQPDDVPLATQARAAPPAPPRECVLCHQPRAVLAELEELEEEESENEEAAHPLHLVAYELAQEEADEAAPSRVVLMHTVCAEWTRDLFQRPDGSWRPRTISGWVDNVWRDGCSPVQDALRATCFECSRAGAGVCCERCRTAYHYPCARQLEREGSVVMRYSEGGGLRPQARYRFWCPSCRPAKG